MKAIIKGRKSITTYRGGTKINDKQFWSAPVDILIPASVTDVINESNKKSIKVKVIVEAGNIPMRERVEEEFVRRGTLVVPDFVANAGGVISSYAEYRGYNPKRMFDLIERKICKSTYAVMSKSVATGRNPRRIALKIALEKIEKKKREGRRR